MRHQYSVMVDEPGPFASLATWERHLASLEALPDRTLLKQQMVEVAKAVIEKKDSKSGPVSW